MLGIGGTEMMVIAIIALLVVGPERLPHVMRQAGRWYGQLRRAADDLRRAFVLEADRQDASDRYRQLQERRKQAQEARRKAQEAAGGEGATQPDPVSAQQPPAPTVVVEGAEPVEAPNDLPPDAPHPDAFHRDEDFRAGDDHR